MNEVNNPNLTSGIERTIDSNEVRANLHELVPGIGLWERVTMEYWNIGKMEE